MVQFLGNKNKILNWNNFGEWLKRPSCLRVTMDMMQISYCGP